MRIAVTRSGGFAGVVRRGEADTADSAELAALADAVGAGLAVPASGRPSTGPGQPDRFTYSIAIGDAAPTTLPEHALDEPMRRLVALVLDPPAEGGAATGSTPTSPAGETPPR